MQEIIGRGQQAPSGHILFTPRAKKVLELALREALQLGHNYIGTEHILLGLIREGEGVAAQVLVKLGADLKGVRRLVIQLLSGYQGKEPVASGGTQPEGAPAGSVVLDQFGRNLTQAARENKLDPVIGRELAGEETFAQHDPSRSLQHLGSRWQHERDLRPPLPRPERQLVSTRP